MPTQKLIIDTDPGIDDAMAIHYAFAHEDLDLIGLTTIFGNVFVEQATRNAIVLTDQAGRIIPVCEGA
ncbi:MAG: nucleoside hydrolase, partial [Alphaproteobacteria bacterium]|nr:nucleoside hydrolase [Alphaproteobacteria bacterium]